MRRVLLTAGLAALPLLFAGNAHAAGGHPKEPIEHEWHSQGLFGSYDQRQLQRGYQVYRTVCSSCHSMKLVAFRHLGQPGGPYHLDACPEELGLADTVDCSDPAANPFVKAIAADFTITAGVDDSGDPLSRPGLPSDYFPSPYANQQQAMLANGGANPPDMSLLVKAREDGRNYIYSLITGYPGLPKGPAEIPEEITVPPGQYYNPYYHGDTLSLMKAEYLDEDGHLLPGVHAPDGGSFKMAPPLSQDCLVTYEDGTDCTVEQMAEDVVAFLQWAAEPELEQRKRMGGFVLLYLFAFAGIVYASYRQIWRNVEH
ncbi:cytochrome c1 [Parvularcula dongshanensis]|uniref:Cytochrome c1 n=1 Tax=Parvularcula dongshanensis TaxID=1173995 RepID=A0A840I6H8_9PROT|nr:cytochrome c1 [Parvularcula dongshanensis]MBB4659784.1 ubiquinol-cytochrome c reductase cytochrome c1 subunit [Parvularcula dongshanensis]